MDTRRVVVPGHVGASGRMNRLDLPAVSPWKRCLDRAIVVLMVGVGVLGAVALVMYLTERGSDPGDQSGGGNARKAIGQQHDASEQQPDAVPAPDPGEAAERERTEEPQGRETVTPFQDIDTRTLPALLAERGHVPSASFKAFVAEIEVLRGGIVRYRAFDYRGSSRDRYGDPGDRSWWPASNVKLYAAVAALERLNALGFSNRASVTFRYDKKEVTNSVRWLVRQAITPSNNVAFDRLVEIVGMDDLNQKFFTARNGFFSTVLQRGYSGRVKDPETTRGSLRESPPLVITEGSKSMEIPARVSQRRYDCPDHGNCTTLLELAETMRRVMLHEYLPPRERFNLTKSDLRLLREALAADRERGQEVVVALQQSFTERGIQVKLYHKPGFAADWFSDVVFVECSGRNRHFIVAMANYPGRNSLDEAARLVGEILAEAKLTSREQGRRR